MLSIVIPTYRYNAYPLVSAISKQAEAAGIAYEIVCRDDASGDYFTAENNRINQLPNCRFLVNSTNLGRGGNLNVLLAESRFDYALILDVDTLPVQSNFIASYLDYVHQKEVAVVFGGIAYKEQEPDKSERLRWVYGMRREALTASQRDTNPYFLLTSNILLPKSALGSSLFSEALTTYGYEDLVLAAKLRHNQISILHIDNPVYHLNLETSEVFLEKTQTALRNFKKALNEGLLTGNESKLGRAYLKIKQFGLRAFIATLFRGIRQPLERHLISEKPLVFWFDVYKLGFLCNLGK